MEIRTIVIALLLGGSVVACDSAEPAPNIRLATVLTTLGHHPADAGAPWAVAVVENGTDRVGPVDVRFTGYGPDGAEVARVSSRQAAVRAGARVAVAAVLLVDPGTAVERVTAEADLITARSAPDAARDARLTASDLLLESTAPGETRLHAILASQYPEPVAAVYAGVICYAPDGTAVGGGQDLWPGPLAPQDRWQVAIGVSLAATAQRCEVYPTLAATALG